MSSTKAWIRYFFRSLYAYDSRKRCAHQSERIDSTLGRRPLLLTPRDTDLQPLAVRFAVTYRSEERKRRALKKEKRKKAVIDDWGIEWREFTYTPIPLKYSRIGGLNVSLRNRMFIDAWKFALNAAAVYGNTRFRILIKGTCDERYASARII